MLNHISSHFDIENFVNPLRIFDFNHKKIQKGTLIYLCEREIRAFDNFSLQFALEKSKELNLPLKIIHPKIYYSHKPKEDFINSQLQKTKKDFENLNLNFEISDFNAFKNNKVAALVIDFNPILNRNYLKGADFKIFEIDSHNIIPARYISNKQEYGAMYLRRKIYNNIEYFLTEFKVSAKPKEVSDFIQNKLPYYSEFRNDPSKNIASNLSKFLNLGFISSQRAALEVIKSDVTNENKEAFLEELIVRKELADNFCLYCKNFKSLDCIPDWAKNSLEEHKNDLRIYNYTLAELKNSKTHDNLWNTNQKELIKTGKIHPYLRMYWAKKIMEWTKSYQEAVDFAIYLNDKYAFDAPSSNGYTGILWAIAGLHDRAFQDWFISGKIRRMTGNSIKKKFNILEYIKRIENL